MSILNCYVEPQRAVLAVDSLSAWVGDTRRHVCKLFPLCHASMIIAGRGHVAMPVSVHQMCAYAVESFDGFLEHWQQILADALQIAARSVEATGKGLHETDGGRQEIVAVGWSEKRGQIEGWLYSYDGANTFMPTRIDGATYGPGDESFVARFPAPWNQTSLIKLARAQLELLQRTAPALVTGGRLIIAQLVPGGMTIAPAGEL